VALTTLRRDGDIAFLGLNRPGKHNALDQAMMDELGAALLNLRRSPCIVVLCSATPVPSPPGQISLSCSNVTPTPGCGALMLTKVALRIHRPATTLYDMTGAGVAVPQLRQTRADVPFPAGASGAARRSRRLSDDDGR